ncbi:MAG: CarD family transcriptional regulator [Desulfarculales bacterium]|jgi:CarD family transcriptional regulator|nr:CarD family transcriptional regulator [Desulfarculales bacterium]
MFKIGQLAVYPAHGVGRIESVEDRDIAGQLYQFYIMRIIDNEMIIMIPTNNASSLGLRDIISPQQVKEVFEILKRTGDTPESRTWNRRYREYMQKIKTGSIFEVAQVLRDLFLLKNDKELSFGERKMLDTARNLLIKELSVAQHASEEKIASDLDEIFC